MLLLLWSCKQQEEQPEAKKPVASFSMLVNGKEWKPYQNPKDPCSSTFYAATGMLGWMGEELPFYTVHAYCDLSGRGDAHSENLLRMQVMNTIAPGIYILDGSYKKDLFDSYIIFQTRKSTGDVKRYINDPKRKAFTVTIEAFLPVKGLSYKGIKGTFEGVVYNEDTPSDSLIIDKGNFTFGIVNGGFEQQCGVQGQCRNDTNSRY